MRVLRFTPLGVTALMAFMLNFATLLQALPGDLDPSFSSDGVVIFGGNGMANDVAIQPDGKIVLVGFNHLADASFVARLSSTGTLDTSFGSSGIVTIDVFSGQAARFNELAIQADGKIVVVGELSVVGESSGDLFVARFNSDGTPDLSFGADGAVTTDVGAVDSASDVVLQPDGKILVAGSSRVNSATGDFALARYNPDGTPDLSFGADGQVTTNLGSVDSASAVALQTNGKFVVAGRSDDDFAVARYNSDGSMDTTFGSGGTVITDFGARDGASGLAIQTNGRIVVAGSSGTPDSSSDIAVARYNSDGTLDSGFGTGGSVTTSFSADSRDFASDIALQADGKIVVAGSSVDRDFDLAVVRFNSNGNLDNTFSDDGKVLTDVRGFGLISGLAIQRNGKIVVAGESEFDFVVARYQAFECGGKDVTILGTDGADSLLGRVVVIPFPSPGVRVEFADVIHGLGGGDSISGLGNDDTICGGTGADVIRGGSGNDTLFGEAGTDTLDGGANTDVCVGGGQAGDTLANCETINTGGGGFSGTWVEVSQKCHPAAGQVKCRLRGTLAVENPGIETTAVPALMAFFLSSDASWDATDTNLAEIKVAPLEGGESREIRLRAKLDVGQNASGQYVIAVLDILNLVPELNEDNNIVISPALQ